MGLKPVWSRVRTDISAIKHPDGGSRWTDTPLNVATLEAHVSDGLPRGACPIKAGESTVMLAVLDMDSHKGATPWDEMMRVACELESGLEMFGLYAIPFRSSGGKGIHLLFMWEAPQDAYSVRQALFAGIEMCGFTSGAKGIADKQIEVFPKQNEVGTGEKDRGSQFILPLAGLSAPINLTFGIVLDREAIVDVDWKMSDPVTVVEQPDRALMTLPDAIESIDRVREALFTIRNDGEKGSPDYDRWFTLCCAVHEATGGSEDGKELFAEWSEQNPEFDPKFYEERVWAYVKPADKRDAAITRGTLFAEASKAGWNSATPEGFADVIFEHEETEHVPAAASGEGFTDGTSPTAGVDGRDLPPFERKKDGTILATIGNLVMACRDPHCAGWRIAHDQFKDEVMVAPPGTAGNAWRSFTDADYVRLRVHLEKNSFDPIGKEAMRDAVGLVAVDNAFDSAQLWINSLTWDGVERIDGFMHRYMGSEDREYATAVSAYTWTALAGRILAPGCQADMVPVFISKQGTGKSSAVMAMSPAPEFYVEISFADKEDDLARRMKGRCIGEIGELTGMRRKEIEAQKAFITRRQENWVPKFKEFATTFPRRLIFIATTNNPRFLTDDTGNRRWLPIEVGDTDKVALKADVEQLWAEAAVRFKRDGIAWQDAERLAQAEHSDHQEDDPWEERARHWLQSGDLTEGSTVADRPYLSTGMFLTDAIRMDIRRQGKGDQMRAANVLKKMGYSRKFIREGADCFWAYVSTQYPLEK